MINGLYMCTNSNFSGNFKLIKKMTGTTSSTGRSFFDVDAHKNQEWLRRRKLRLEQVRKQSNEIAKVLREKVINHDKVRLDEYDRLSEAKFNKWKEDKLDELERKIFSALEEFGEGYRMAEEEPDAEELMKEKYQINHLKALMRGEIALQEEIKRKKLAEENKLSGIQRKKLIRKKEDLRSALVLSVPVKKQLLESHPDLMEEKIQADKRAPTAIKQRINEANILNFPKKVSPTKKKGKKISPQKSCKCKSKTKSSETGPKKGGNTIWINLNDIQNSMGDSEMHFKSSKSSGRSEKSSKERLEKGAVEFYDFSSRYYCRSFKEFPHSVERIDPESEVPNATDLAKIEEDMEKAEARKKAKADILSQERGMEALKRERINLDFNNLMAKLEELNRKEKMLKAQQRNLPDYFHMSEERLDRKLQTRQRMMDQKFESICYEAVTQIPRNQPPEPKPLSRKGEGDFEAGKRSSTRLGFSPVNLNFISPFTSEGDSSEESFPNERFRKAEEIFRKNQLFMDIDATLKEGRELRKAAYESQKCSADEDETNEKEEAKEESLNSLEVSPPEEEEKTKCQESQTEDVKVEEIVNDLEKPKDDSLPVSSSTSYKSPPSVIRSNRLRQFLDYLEGLSEAEGSVLLQPNDRINKFFNDLLHTNNFNEKSQEENRKSRLSPSLEYYIEKLLNMSRESVAELSVSSENVSTPNITDLDVKDSKFSTVPTVFTSSRAEDLIRKSRMDRADQLEKTIRNWKRILEDTKEQSEAEDIPDCPRLALLGDEEDKKESVGPLCPIKSPKIKKKYEEITKKCSERISELSNMLDKVRKDKEKLLTSTSGGSSVSLSKEGKSSEKDLDEDEDSDVDSLRRTSCSLKKLKATVVEEFLDRYKTPTRRETISTTAVADSQSLKEFEESLESWPDVMDELLKRRILTSPFKWSDGEYSSEFTTVSGNQTKPSSIETVIGNFRREISKIKPFTLSDSSPKSSAFDQKYQTLFCTPKSEVTSAGWQPPDNESPFREESSVESINQALTNLGLNWAKSFLKKNEESKAMSSSSNSEGESSSSEMNEYP